jgi:hypothetical protein
MPTPGLVRGCFAPIAEHGLGDPLNAYPHSMAWFRDRLFVGTTRSNLCMLKVSKIRTNLDQWPVECPQRLYQQDMRAQIHAWDPARGWGEVFRSPWLEETDDGDEPLPLPRELGYRCMTVFQGASDPEPALYVGTYAPARGRGGHILRSADGARFEPVARPADWGPGMITLRLLVPFRGRLYTAPTGRAEGNPNVSMSALVYETDDPRSGDWRPVCEPGFGDAGNLGVFEMAACGEWLYAATGNNGGFQLWRTRAEGTPPYTWDRVLVDGAYRGPNNQGAASLCAFDDCLYIGTGIQHGGIDIGNRIGPASPELVRVYPDGHWELLVGQARLTLDGERSPLSGLGPGFGNLFTGYFWRMEHHAGWLYLGTFDWSLMLSYANSSSWPPSFRRAIERVGVERLRQFQAGADLWRSADGENWLPVTQNGFGNPYNYGVRTLQSTPHGLAVGLVNPFAPRVAQRRREGWVYEDNPRGGLEVWLGRDPGRAAP